MLRERLNLSTHAVNEPRPSGSGAARSLTLAARLIAFTFATVGPLIFATPARAAAELNLFAWSEYVPQTVIDGFTRETGVKVNYETYGSNEEMLSKLLTGAGRYDLIQPSEYTVEALIRRDKLEPLDWGRIPNIRNIGKEFLNQPYDPQQRFSVPWMSGTVGIVVNTDKVKEPIRGLADVFQEKHAGRIVAVNDNRELVSCALDVLGLPINQVDKAALAKARPLLAQWTKLVKVFDSDSPKTPLINGDVDLGLVWSGEAAACWNQDHKFKYILPAEGAHQFIDNLCIPKTAAHKREAMLFMNYILRSDVSKLISDKFPYTNPNVEARKLLSKDQLANPASYPDTTGIRLETFRDIGKSAAAIDKLMTDIKANGG
jgi:spermidine/putrescine transport system substrate-binding protein